MIKIAYTCISLKLFFKVSPVYCQKKKKKPPWEVVETSASFPSREGAVWCLAEIRAMEHSVLPPTGQQASLGCPSQTSKSLAHVALGKHSLPLKALLISLVQLFFNSSSSQLSP